MKSLTRTFIISLVIAVAFALLSSAAPASAADSSTARVVDFKGAPPFKRRVVAQDTEADFARFEEVAPTVGERRRVVSFRGRPPYRRSVETVTEADVADFARFEEEPAEARRPRRSGPPGKMNSHRRR